MTTYEDVEQRTCKAGIGKNREADGKARRDGVLDLLGKATPGTFQPSLQIDGTGAKLLIEALSGRRSYDMESSGKKNRLVPRRQRVVASRLNDGANAEQ